MVTKEEQPQIPVIPEPSVGEPQPTSYTQRIDAEIDRFLTTSHALVTAITELLALAPQEHTENSKD